MATVVFKDLFSKQSTAYLKFRPTYPPELYHYLSTLTGEHDLALDVATGNGQAAIGLSNHYKKVIATDASPNQIANAVAKSNITYKVLKAELNEGELLENGFEKSSFDVITVACGAHWLKHDIFNQTVQWLLKPHGVYAIWGTVRPFFDCLPLDSALDRYYTVAVAQYASPELQHTAQRYLTIPFPFREVFANEHTNERPSFKMQLEWSFEQFLGELIFHKRLGGHLFWATVVDMISFSQKVFSGRLSSSSRIQTTTALSGINPLVEFEPIFKDAWGPIESKRKLTVEIFMRIGYPIAKDT